MAYTNTWSDTTPSGSLPAKEIDTAFQNFRKDIHERMDSIFVDWTADPVVLKDAFGGPVEGKSIYVPGHAFVSDNDIVHTSTKIVIGTDSDLYAPVILPNGAKITGFQAMVIPGLGTMTVRLGYISHGLANPAFNTVDSNTHVGSSGITLIDNSDSSLAHVVDINRYYSLWITTDSSLVSPSAIFGVQIVYNIDNVKQTI